jgi:hypothetical protein
MTGQWWESLARIIWWLTSRVFAPVMAIAWPVFAIYGGYHVPPQEMSALNLHGREFALLIGTASGGWDCRSRPNCVVIPSQHSYVILPQALGNAAVTLIENQGGDISRSEHPGLALLAVGIWLVCVYGAWRYCRPLRNHLTIVGADTRPR